MARIFESGAMRNDDTDKIDYEGFLNPLVLKRFGEYMHQHRLLEDGSLRASDNWTQGIPLDSAMKSAWRHFHDWHMEHRGYESREGLEAALCGLLFNVQSYLLTILEEKQGGHWTPFNSKEIESLLKNTKELDASPYGRNPELADNAWPYDRNDVFADVPGSGAFADAQQQELFGEAPYFTAPIEEEIVDNIGSYPFTETSKNWVEAWPKWFQNVVGAVGKGK